MDIVKHINVNNYSRKVKVQFCDFAKDFNLFDNLFIKILSKYYIVEISNEPEFLFYSCFGTKFLEYNKCIKIYFTMENIRPDFNQCDYAMGYDFIDFGKRYIRHGFSLQKYIPNNIDYSSRKFCNFLYSNENIGDGSIVRKEFCKSLMNYKPVDCPGAVLNNMKNSFGKRSSADWKISKRKFIKDYKFTIAFENSCSPGYTTEKLIDPLIANSIPIYWGNPIVENDFNGKAFINCHNFKNFNEVIEYVKYLDTHTDQYMEMLRQPPLNQNTPSYEEQIEKFIVYVVEKGTKQICDPLNLFSQPFCTYKRIIEKTVNGILNPILEKIGINNSHLLDSMLYTNFFLPNFGNEIDLLSKETKKMIESKQTQIVTKGWLNSLNQNKEIFEQRKNLLIWLEDLYNSPNFTPIINWTSDKALKEKYEKLFSMLCPNSAKNIRKVRVGGKIDGAYVMLEPGHQGIAYSFNTFNITHWDEEMASKGFKIWQFIDAHTVPAKHPNIIYTHGLPFGNEDGYNLNTICRNLCHINEKNIILHLNVEGTEWDILKSTADDGFSAFSQIILEVHGLINTDRLEEYKETLTKILVTHVPVHFHFHNNSVLLGFDNFVVSNIAQISFARRDIDEFFPSPETLPCSLDIPNISSRPDIFIGNFAVISGKYSTM